MTANVEVTTTPFDPAQPFGSAAIAWQERGWPVFPLPSGRKQPPPPGFTGYSGAVASGADVFTWLQIDGRGGANLGIRLPRGVLVDGQEYWAVGIDVDSYPKGGKLKQGAVTLARWEKQAGVEFPPTYRITSRGQDNPSGKKLYLVPAGTMLRTADGDCEILQFHHRYAVTAPSRNDDDGRVVRLYDERTGEEITDGEAIPRPEDLPVLPPELVEVLREDKAASDTKELAPGEAHEFIRAMPGGDPCKSMVGAIERARAATAGGSRHDEMLRAVAAILRQGEMGHTGVAKALEHAREAFISAVGAERKGGTREASSEFDRMVNGVRGIGLIKAKPTPEAQRGCHCGVAIDDATIREALASGDFTPEELAAEVGIERVKTVLATLPGRQPVAEPAPVPAPGANGHNSAAAPSGANPVPAEKPTRQQRRVDLTAFSYDDRGNGQRFLALFGDVVAWVPDAKITRVWDADGYWHSDTGSRMRHLAELMTDRMQVAARLMTRQAEKIAASTDKEDPQQKAAMEQASNIAKAFTIWVTKSRMDARLRAVVTSAQSHPGIEVDSREWDADPRLLNVANGTIELGVEGEIVFREHRPGDRLTKQAATAYDANAACPRFEEFLAAAQPDPAVRRLVRALTGVSLLGDNAQRLLPIMIGESGSGKTTLFEILTGVLDHRRGIGYGGSYNLDVMRPRKSGGGNPDLMALLGKRLIWTVEAADGLVLNADQIKRFADYGHRQVRDNYAQKDQVVDHLITFTPWLGTNHPPVVEGADDALRNRIVAVPWSIKRERKDQDPNLANKIIDNEASGVLNWMLAGYVDAMQQPEIINDRPEIVKHTEELLFREIDIYARWLAENTEPCPCEDGKACVPCGDAWHEFSAWCGEENEPKGTKHLFGRKLKDAGYLSKPARLDGGVVKVYRGLKFNDDLLSDRARSARTAARNSPDQEAGGVSI